MTDDTLKAERYFWCEDGFICDHMKEAAESTPDEQLYEEVEPVAELNKLAAAVEELNFKYEFMALVDYRLALSADEAWTARSREETNHD
jgi:hypothetical protein